MWPINSSIGARRGRGGRSPSPWPRRHEALSVIKEKSAIGKSGRKACGNATLSPETARGRVPGLPTAPGSTENSTSLVSPLFVIPELDLSAPIRCSIPGPDCHTDRVQGAAASQLGTFLASTTPAEALKTHLPLPFVVPELVTAAPARCSTECSDDSTNRLVKLMSARRYKVFGDVLARSTSVLQPSHVKMLKQQPSLPAAQLQMADKGDFPRPTPRPSFGYCQGNRQLREPWPPPFILLTIVLTPQGTPTPCSPRSTSRKRCYACSRALGVYQNQGYSLGSNYVQQAVPEAWWY
ncbi:hypothetical protein BRADI_1g38200v3 [Brachypodium distachyon]|uniref:Uncharacterized protein n=1 Tax=Brachypodium distachyon TaxID=15368 RepID=I1GY38_BRADI|nr:hypothetical protein BRADI_1g38200v3 [Brachypodium distachyon]